MTQKRLISMLPITQKLCVGTYSHLCEMYKLFIQKYIIIAKGIRLLDKIAILVYTGTILYHSPVENQNDLEPHFKVFFFVDCCC